MTTNETALREAVAEIKRRTGLLLHQNTGRWDMRKEHDKRTVDVLTANQQIANEALQSPSQPVTMAIEQCGECVGTGCGPVVDGADTTCATCKGSGNAPGAQWHDVSSQPIAALPVTAMGLKPACQAWQEKRGVWPRVFVDEAFEAGWIAALTAHPQASPPPVQPVVVEGLAVERIANAMAADNDSEAMFMLGDNQGGWQQLAKVAIAAMNPPLAHSQTDTQEGEESRRLRIGWWNDMRKRGVTQDDAIAKINAALASPQHGDAAQQQEQQP